MSQDQKNETPMSKRFFPALLAIIGREKYERFYARCRDLYSNHELPKNPKLQWHLIDEAFEQLFSDKVKKMKQFGRLPFVYPFLQLYIKPAMRQYPSEGWKMEWIQNDKSAIRFNMRSCFYYDTLSKYGAPELTASFCRVDDLIYGNMSPYLLWQRTMTIARGDAYCDFCFACASKRQQE